MIILMPEGIEGGFPIMKRSIVVVIVIIIIFVFLPLVVVSGCVGPKNPEGLVGGGSENGGAGGSSGDRINSGSGSDSGAGIVCTVFPQYDWARQILGNKAGEMELTLLLDNKADLHNFQPSTDDIIKISTCDLFIYVGGESDGWVDDALKETSNKDMAVINLLDALGNSAKDEEVIEGMEDAEGEDEDENADGGGYDEHVWLSLGNAATFCKEIAAALSSLDPDNAREYQNNLEVYLGKLSVLDAEYRTAADAASVKTLLFGDRFPFRYLMDDYGLRYYAAFPGCSAETEASFETIIFLAGKVDELGLKNVMVTESADQSIAKTIIANTAGKDQQILVLDAMQSVTPGDIESGTAYLSVMESNLDILKEAMESGK